LKKIRPFLFEIGRNSAAELSGRSTFYSAIFDSCGRTIGQLATLKMREVQVLRPADGAAGDAGGQAVGEQPRAAGRRHFRATDGGRPHEGLPSRRPQGPRGHLPPTWRPYARYTATKI
jgi:hypothetical protein